MTNKFGPLKVGIGGPVGSGKTSLTEALCKKLSKTISMAVISNDIYTIEDAEYFGNLEDKTGCANEIQLPLLNTDSRPMVPDTVRIP